MGRPKGSKNQKSDAKPVKEKLDKKVNFTILNRFLANAADLFADMSLQYRESNRLTSESLKALELMMGGPPPELLPEPTTESVPSTEPVKEAVRGESKPTDLAAIFGTEPTKDPVSQ